MAMCYQSNSTFLFLLIYLYDVGRVAVTECFKLMYIYIYTQPFLTHRQRPICLYVAKGGPV